MKAALLSLILASGLFVSGNARAASPVVIEEFVDFQCVYCARGAATMEQLAGEYGSKVKLILRNMPLKSHDQAEAAARAYLAVSLMDETLAGAFQKSIFANQPRLENEGEKFLLETAARLGLDSGKVRAEMSAKGVSDRLDDDRRAFERHGFSGTPSFVIGTDEVTGDRGYGAFKKIIDLQLAVAR